MALTVHGVFIHTSLEPGSGGNTLAGVTASIDTCMPGFSMSHLPRSWCQAMGYHCDRPVCLGEDRGGIWTLGWRGHGVCRDQWAGWSVASLEGKHAEMARPGL